MRGGLRFAELLAKKPDAVTAYDKAMKASALNSLRAE